MYWGMIARLRSDTLIIDAPVPKHTSGSTDSPSGTNTTVLASLSASSFSGTTHSLPLVHRADTQRPEDLQSEIFSDSCEDREQALTLWELEPPTVHPRRLESHLEMSYGLVP